MHTLVIDAGNTQVKCGVFEQNQLVRTERISYEELAEELPKCIQLYAVEAILVSDVSGKITAIFEAISLAIPIHFLSPSFQLPFQNHYQSATLGSDRIALVAGAMSVFPDTHCLVIDAGTCVTYDLITSSHAYLGGAISPGLHMRLKAMHSFTGKLPLPGWEAPRSYMGNTTHDCLLAGAYYGLVGEIEYMVARYASEYEGLQVILSGGDASELAMNIKTSIFVHEHLLLYGLNKLLIHNAE